MKHDWDVQCKYFESPDLVVGSLGQAGPRTTSSKSAQWQRIEKLQDWLAKQGMKEEKEKACAADEQRMEKLEKKGQERW